jgi:predicted sugar kinase
LAGEDEVDAFQSLPAVSPAVTEELIGIVRDGIVPAAAMGQFDLFAENLYRYGHLSGQCFAARQGGPYNGPVLTALVERIQRFGFRGVGQTSWGPTLFVAAPSHELAAALSEQLAAGSGAEELELTITSPCNEGAQIEVAGDRLIEPLQVS